MILTLNNLSLFENLQPNYSLWLPWQINYSLSVFWVIENISVIYWSPQAKKYVNGLIWPELPKSESIDFGKQRILFVTAINTSWQIDLRNWCSQPCIVYIGLNNFVTTEGKIWLNAIEAVARALLYSFIFFETFLKVKLIHSAQAW